MGAPMSTKPRSSVTWLLLALISAGALTWYFFGSTEAQIAPLGVEVSAKEETPEPESLAAHRNDQAEPARVAVEEASSDESPVRDTTPPASGDELDAFWCRVVEAKTAAPIAGAALSNHEPGSWTKLHRSSLLNSKPSGGDGLIEVRAPLTSRIIARLNAPGYGPVILQVGPGHETADRALEIRLSVSAHLTVRLLDASNAPVPGARCRLATRPYSIARPEGLSIFSSDVEWSLDSDDDGICRFTDLPPAAPLTLEIRQGAKIVHREPVQLIFEAGEQRELERRLGAGTTVRGRLLDQENTPVGRTEVWLTQDAQNDRLGRERIYFTDSDSRRVSQKARTDSEGHFLFEGVDPGTWWIGPQCKSNYEAPRAKDVAPIAVPLEVLEYQAHHDIELHSPRGLSIRGRILTPDGGTPERVNLSNDSELGGANVHVEGNEFIVGPLADVPHRLRARAYRSEFAPSERQEALAGDHEVEVFLRAGAKLAGSFVDARTGEACGAAITISCPENGHLSMGLRDEQDFTLYGLLPGAYDLIARTEHGLIGWIRDLQIDASSQYEGLVVRLDEGSKLRISYEGATDYVQYRVLHEGVLVAADGLRSGTSALKVVPIGALDVRISRAGEVVEERRVNCAAGAVTEADFELH